jgi:hypothetical protein
MANGASGGLIWKVRGMKHFFLACEQDVFDQTLAGA